ncbi:MAG: OmpH family outer membrane protein [Phycisphaeraceae bacterium]|nr:OmpH family outer membrane protein [Phycisphaeraceae bacterium]MBX3368124.1 OmpH family outer membrane protein [Phycisphaeraceae bacterium]QYK47794.1 MAG: OmpH family outer membrane protein [Phycisphaeraceae bacterium]
MPLNRSYIVVALCLGVGLGGALLGERRASAAAEAEAVLKASATAVAIVDLERVMEGLTEKKKREDDMRALIAQRQATLDDLKKQLDGLAKQIELTPKTDRAKLREIKQRQIEIAAQAEARKQALQTLIALETGEILREIYLKINNAISRVAAKDGWDLVLLDNRSINIPESLTDREINFIIQSRTVLHATNSVDISDDIITLMNAEFGK